MSNNITDVVLNEKNFRTQQKYVVLIEKKPIKKTIGSLRGQSPFEWLKRVIDVEVVEGVHLTEYSCFFDNKADALEYVKENNIKYHSIVMIELVLPPIRRSKGV